MSTTLLYIKSHQKQLFQIGFTLLLVALGIYFIRHQQVELANVKTTLAQASPLWVFIGVLLIFAFVVVQGIMYQVSFKAIHQKIRLSTGISLFLKRNLVSVFLPAGLVTNMLFFNKEVEQKEGLNKTQIYFASSIFTFCSIFSSIIIGLPALVWLYLQNQPFEQLTFGIISTLLLLGAIGYFVYDFLQKGKIYNWLATKFPSFVELLSELNNQSVDRRKIIEVIAWSCVIEVIGILHLYIAIIALGGVATWEAAIIGYALVLLILMSSPLLRGIGTIELALTYVLTLFGLSTALAISVTFLFRFFEFWGLLILGAVAFVAQKSNVLVRIFPALLLFVLGLINILSALTPALPERLQMLHQVLHIEAIHGSAYLVLLTGIIMLFVSIFLLKGLRNAWIAAVALSAISLMAHLAKGIDWEESTIALLSLVSLIYQREQYFIQPDLKLVKRTWLPAVVAVASVWIFGTLAFYFLDAAHFQADFSLTESFEETITTFFLLNVDLVPQTAFGKEFLIGMRLLGGLTLVYVAFILLRPLVLRPDETEESQREKAKDLVEKYGKGSLDYFKTYSDKKFWFTADEEGFVAFKASSNYAIVLENPVCANDEAMEKAILGFDTWCKRNGLRPAYYRIPELSKTIYQKNKKQLLPIGEEAIIDLTTWSLEGKSKKSLRNAVNKTTKEGYSFNVHHAPQKDGFLQQLSAVSNQWLQDMDRKEIVFSQGVFDIAELKHQAIISVENQEGKILAFVNIISSKNNGEANFDLMRKTADAPNGIMDFLFINMFEYFKSAGFTSCNIGLVPMAGITEPQNLQERVIKTAYEKMKNFGHYKSLRNYKDKFSPTWTMNYFAYDAAFDLIYLPNAMQKVIKY